MGGGYKTAFQRNPEWTYKQVAGYGAEVRSGILVVQNCYEWKEIEKFSFYDVVISRVRRLNICQRFWLVMQEIARVLKPDGICCII